LSVRYGLKSANTPFPDRSIAATLAKPDHASEEKTQAYCSLQRLPRAYGPTHKSQSPLRPNG
jgi:hypothetical protein